MKEYIQIQNLLKDIDPLFFSDYVKSLGWEQFNNKKSFVGIYFYHNEVDDFQITIPLDKNLVDYEEALIKALETFSIQQQKSVLEIAEILSNPKSDVLKIRVNKKEIIGGSIPILDALDIFNNIKKMTESVAKKILKSEYKEAYEDDDFADVKDTVDKFIESCKIGQTQVGSYVVPVLYPFGDKNQISMLNISDSLSRKVTKEIIFGIKKIKDDIDSGTKFDSSDLFDYKDENYEFIQSVLDMGLDEEGVEIYLSAELYPDNNSKVIEEVYIDSNYKTELSLIAEALSLDTKKMDIQKHIQIIGKVKELMSNPTLEERDGGEVTVVYIGDNQSLENKKIRLEIDDYLKAITAHKAGKNVRVTAELKPNTKTIYLCKNFELLD